jgi:hypothetical protein
MATTGVTGGAWRAHVTRAGTVEPWDGSAPLAWLVAADDRWHDPATDVGVRHERIDGTAVVETRMRIPGGDAVQRVWSVADRGGITLVEVRNDSPLPIACAFTRGDLLTVRPPSGGPLEGIALPAGSIALPVGHRSGVVVGLAHGAPAAGVLPTGLPDAESVARGWRARSDKASRLDLPDAPAVHGVRAARCEVVLSGLADPEVDPRRFLLGAGELVRMGELDPRSIGDLALAVAGAVAALERSDDGLVPAALAAAGVVLAHAGERRALGDLARIGDVGNATPPLAPDEDGDIVAVAATEGLLARGSRLFPTGIPPQWLGRDLEAHGLVAGPSSRLSLALRWHGPNAAVLWEVTGEPVTLTADVAGRPWGSAGLRGEALWRLPPP